MPVVTPSTGTGLDRFVQIIQTDKQPNAARGDAAIQKGDDFFGQGLEAGNDTFSTTVGGVAESVEFTLVA